MISAAVSAAMRPHSGSRLSSWRESGIETATEASGVPSAFPPFGYAYYKAKDKLQDEGKAGLSPGILDRE
ncbi:hypothetical protein [Streptomyces massasporeus]|uniref:hypothetical protein n=1 Tax=Streptomyces massasporeus TaxID=67324 RepID=UPI0036651BBC